MSIDNDIADELTRTGPPAHKFDEVGEKVTVRIQSIEKRQQTEFGTGKPLVWEDGSPRWQYVVTGVDIATGDETRLYAKGDMLRAFKAALTEAEAKPAVDGQLTVKFTGTEKGANGFVKKLYAAKYVPPAPVADVDFDEL